MNLAKLALGLTPILLGAACIPPERQVSGYDAVKNGPAILTGYLRSPIELTLYTSANDAKVHRYKNCISGTVENMDYRNMILYDKKLVEIKGRVESYYISDDPFEAMLVKIKNNCSSRKVFVATQIRVIDR